MTLDRLFQSVYEPRVAHSLYTSSLCEVFCSFKSRAFICLSILLSPRRAIILMLGYAAHLRSLIDHLFVVAHAMHTGDFCTLVSLLSPLQSLSLDLVLRTISECRCGKPCSRCQGPLKYLGLLMLLFPGRPWSLEGRAEALVICCSSS